MKIFTYAAMKTTKNICCSSSC